jgi:hypothetical protein
VCPDRASAGHQDPQRWFNLGVAEGLQAAVGVDPWCKSPCQ